MSPIALVSGGSGWLGTRVLLALSRGLADVPELADPETDLELRTLAVSAEDERALLAAAPAACIARGDLRDRAALDASCAVFPATELALAELHRARSVRIDAEQVWLAVSSSPYRG